MFTSNTSIDIFTRNGYSYDKLIKGESLTFDADGSTGSNSLVFNIGLGTSPAPQSNYYVKFYNDIITPNGDVLINTTNGADIKFRNLFNSDNIYFSATTGTRTGSYEFEKAENPSNILDDFTGGSIIPNSYWDNTYASSSTASTVSAGSNIEVTPSGNDYNVSTVDSPNFEDISVSGTGDFSYIEISGTSIDDIFLRADSLIVSNGLDWNPATRNLQWGGVLGEDVSMIPATNGASSINFGLDSSAFLSEFDVHMGDGIYLNKRSQITSAVTSGIYLENGGVTISNFELDATVSLSNTSAMMTYDDYGSFMINPTVTLMSHGLSPDNAQWVLFDDSALFSTGDYVITSDVTTGITIGNIEETNYIEFNSSEDAVYRGNDFNVESGSMSSGGTDLYQIFVTPSSIEPIPSLDSLVTGTTSSTDNAIARFDGTTGKLIQNSGVIIDDSNNITGAASLTTASVRGTSDQDNYINFSNSGIDINVDAGDSLDLSRGGTRFFGHITNSIYSFNPDNNDRDLWMKDSSGNVVFSSNAGDSQIIIGHGTYNGSGSSLALTSSRADNAQINFEDSGVDKTTPAKGDLWYNGTNLYFHNGTSNIDLLSESPSLGSFVTGATSSTDNAIARFDGATGKLIQNSGVIIDDSDNITGAASLTTASVKGTSDQNNYIDFTFTGIDINVNANSSLDLSRGGTRYFGHTSTNKYTFNPDGQDLDFDFRDSTGNVLMTSNGGNSQIIVGNGTFNGSGSKMAFTDSDANTAQINFSDSGVDKTTPEDGDLWYNGTNLYFNNGTTNVDLLNSGSTGSTTFVNQSRETYPILTSDGYESTPRSGITATIVEIDKDMIATGLTIHLDEPVGGTRTVLSIYDDSGSLLSYTVTLSGESLSSGFNTIELQSEIQLQGGTKYYVAVLDEWGGSSELELSKLDIIKQKDFAVSGVIDRVKGLPPVSDISSLMVTASASTYANYFEVTGYSNI